MSHSSSITRTFRRIGRTAPGAVFLEGERALTYARASEEVVKRADHFRRKADGASVVIKGANTVDWVLSFLAARESGCIPILAPADMSAQQQNELGEVIGKYYLFDTSKGRGSMINLSATRRTLPKDTGFGLLTSGTTGVPRVVLRSDDSLLLEGKRYVDAFGLSPADRILAALPLSHAFALGMALGGALASGCSLHLVPRFTPRTVARLVQDCRCTVLPLVPASARLVCDALPSASSATAALRHVIIGAGPVSPELERHVFDRLGLRPARNYGSSETGATLGSIGQSVPDWVTGAPLPGVEAAIMGEDNNGALFLRMDAPFIGYLSPQGLDRSRVSPDGWYSTGDLAHRIGSEITVTGRLGGGLRRGGRFIHPAELENALRRHPDVVEATVVGRHDTHGEDVIEAHLELRAGMSVGVEELRRHLNAYVESYKIPAIWHFYDTLPLTSGGKPDRSALVQ